MLARRAKRALRRSERAQSLAELALAVPALLILLLVGVDFARVYYADIVVTNAARVGAQYASISEEHAKDTSTIQTLVLQEASNLDPDPAVQTRTGTDAAGNTYVEVTVTYQMDMLMDWPGLPNSVTVQRALRMSIQP
jgi:Flp pilus assembly protein TadG